MAATDDPPCHKFFPSIFQSSIIYRVMLTVIGSQFLKSIEFEDDMNKHQFE